ncbi:ribose transport system ATP-binding protein/rhamnose transport system ATP-binding protein [Actinocorallia herbida]|uniref:Ribose transport system ATP-binding protein/rhamnose transport system ATP-binding protein n=1 Tax=Actinocorallia herbida TaxID=58109 RepID=A0A3N1D0Q3_9ACTN|nr:sugar ABC transporter ATP-binding protein [Actinocorallia herbida]ROO87101.1 ribose transport system ATP-binding protein/rhamnose transport system ATP-binding protein [Actinocorallia herbida]
MSAPAVVAHGVSKRFGAFTALDGVDLALEAGEVHGLIGSNGAGKSTLIKVLCGAHVPDTGRLEVEGHKVDCATPAQAEKAGITVVHQETHLFPELTVADNIVVAAPHRRAGLLRDRRADRAEAAELLAVLGVELDPDRRAGTLDLAEKKLLQVARALRAKPKLLILDEPTAALEPRQSRRITELVRRLASDGLAVMFVSHDLDEVRGLCDRITAMRDGRIVARLERAEATPRGLAELVAGRALAGAPDRGVHEAGDVLVRADLPDAPGLALRHREVVTLTGILGSGAGRYARTLAGARRPAKPERGERPGGVTVGERRLAPHNRVGAVAAGVGFVPEERKRDGVQPLLSIERNIVLGDVSAFTRFGMLDRRKTRTEALRLIEELDIRPADPTYLAGLLSGGNQQKVLIARWLAAGARVLVVEEPTHGIDIGAKEHVLRQLRAFADERGCVVVVALESEEFRSITDRYLAFRRGRLVAELTADVTHADLMTACLGENPEGPAS